MNNRAHSSEIELLKRTDCLLKQLPDPSISKILTFGRHHPGTKIAKKETGSIPRCATAARGALQTSRAWIGLQQSYSEGARLVEGKPSNRNTSSSTIWMSTRRPNRKVSNYTDDKWINPQRWEETSKKRRKTPETRTLRPLERTKTPHQQGTKLDGEWLWQNDRIRLQKVDNEKLLWAKRTCFKSMQRN